ncbi:hypothetical protein N5C55_02365 [Pseudomonas otitidis]|uniref:hypothetical protein n=1 Tax=Metapseudomonas otitidis TaxID=319939 RepID=UPI00244A9DF2|nr:hypothetical protein [Pseudomonas otitidis]MDH1105859.1 hypothetical protein [Pseudomonas otitidis]MDH1157006.1 hypothetical protein [Pseudomonas otitidis]MDH1162310.1 hypothetical protein [Pseudomonas otitidis]
MRFQVGKPRQDAQAKKKPTLEGRFLPSKGTIDVETTDMHAPTARWVQGHDRAPR